MAKFTSRDGADQNGVRAEVTVQTGTGLITDLNENGPNAQVVLKVEGFQRPVMGWLSKKDPLYPKVVEAREQGREIAYRIESQRKRGVDRNIPIDTLRVTMDEASKHCMNIFAGMDGTLSEEAVTNPAEDPNGGRIRAEGPPQQTPAAGGGAPNAAQALDALAKARQGGLPQGVVDAAAALALAAGATVKQVTEAGVDAQADGTQPEVRGRVRSAEAAPHIGYNTDGRLNLGSYAVQAAVGAESLAVDLMAANNLRVMEAHNAAVDAGEIDADKMDAPDPVNYRNAAALGLVLLDLADRVQVGAYGGGRPDRMANSHTRARGYVYDAVKSDFPVPFGEPREVHESWKESVVTESVARFLNAAEMAVTIEDIPTPSQPENETGDQGDQVAPEPSPAPQADQTPAPQADQTPAPQADQTPAPENAGQQAAQGKPRVPVEGDQDFVAPTDDIVQRFRALSLAAGFEATPNSPVSVYLTNKFKVAAVRKVHGPALDQMLTWYENQGEQAAARFRAHVLSEAEAGQAAKSA